MEWLEEKQVPQRRQYHKGLLKETGDRKNWRMIIIVMSS